MGLTGYERCLSFLVEVDDAMVVFNAGAFEGDVAVLVPANRRVPVLQVVQGDPGRVDVLIDSDQVGLIRVQDHAQSWGEEKYTLFFYSGN